MKNNKRLDNPVTPMDLQVFALSDEEMEQRLLEMFGAEQDDGLQEGTPEGDALQQSGPIEGAPVEGQVDEIDPGNPGPPQDLSGDGAPVDDGQQGGIPLEPKFASIEEQAKGYRNLEALMTRTRTELAQANELNNQLQAMVDAQQNQLSMYQSPAGDAKQDEGNAKDDRDFTDLFYDDMKGAIKEAALEAIMPELEPIKSRFEMADRQERWAAQINSFAEQHPDLGEYQEAMADIMVQHPELKDHPNGLQFAYDMAKGRSGVKDPRTLLQDEEFLNQNIISNQDIRDRIIKEYLAELKGGTPPASIGVTPAGGQMPLTPPRRPKTMEEANEMALAYFQK